MTDQTALIDQLAREYARIAPLGLPCILSDHPEAVSRMRKVGHELFEAGGTREMSSAIVAIHELTDGVFPTGADFNRLWDGVGPWRA